MKWISVKDRLPSDVMDVLIGGECCEVCYNIDIGFYEKGEWILKTGEDLYYAVTHWMQLPEPPNK